MGNPRTRNFLDLNLKQYLLAAFSGLLLTLCFPKFGQPVVAWTALLPLLFLIATHKPRACFTLGWFAGVCHGLSLLYWITFVVNHYGNLSFPVSIAVCFLLVSYLAIFPALFCTGLSWLRRRGLPWLLFAPFLWVALEFGKGHLFTGFPWANLGYSQYRWLPFIQLADLTGVYGISFFLVTSNCLLFQFLLVRRGKVFTRILSLLFLVGLVLTVHGYGRWRLAPLENHSSPSLKIALVQGNIAQDTKWDPAYQQATVKKYLRLTEAVTKKEPDLVVWPETATPFFFQADPKNSETLVQEMGKLKKPLLFGSPAYRRKEDQLRLYNRAYLLNNLGQVAGYYDKIHLVPFGEYVPLKRILFFVDKLVQAAGDFASGDGAVVLELPPARIGVLICYEGIFPKLSRDLVGAGANLLINITNDAWYGRTSAPYQHLSMAAIRTVENRVPMARCANTGISAFIDAQGRIHQPTGLFEDATIVGTVKLGHGKTIYRRYGDWFAWSCLGVTALVLAYSLLRRPAG
jgi:apolipoprotein N-acyltransferase